MFKKLKDKIAEEVKSSPQRIQQLTQSVTERIQSATSDDNFFSIADDESSPVGSVLEPGFSNIALTSPTMSSVQMRRNSNSSIASDASFLPKYDLTDSYHLQSDLDISASEVEDNASTSSQLGHLTKEQIYAAFQKSQMRYHKYRGRFTDIANHYKELERENAKMKAVLGETQDKALRRVAELREQCLLEQKAKAHLENVLRVELDEKQYIIDTLKTKINLLQVNKGSSEQLKSEFRADASSLDDTNNLDGLTKDLKDARIEIETLNGQIQEMKANVIVVSSKETNLKQKIAELDEALKQKSQECQKISEREKENNLITAQTKMNLHTEIQNRDIKIENLQHDVETLRSELEQCDGTRNVKLDNLQSQNTRLIEKVEELALKCNNYESEMLKMEQLRAEIQSLNETVRALQNNLKRLQEEKEVLERDTQAEQLSKQKEDYEARIEVLRSNTKQHLLTLESKIKNKFKEEFEQKEQRLKLELEEKLGELSNSDGDVKEVRLKLMEKEGEITKLNLVVAELRENLTKQLGKYDDLETNHLELISESADVRNRFALQERENAELTNEVAAFEDGVNVYQNRIRDLEGQTSSLNFLLDETKHSNFELQKEVESLRENLQTLQIENGHYADVHELNAALQSEISRLKNEYDELASEKDRLNNDASELKLECSKLKRDSSDLLCNLEKVVEENRLLQNDNEKLKVCGGNVNAEMTALKRQLVSSQNDVLRLRENNNALTEKVTRAEAAASEVEAIQTVLNDTQQKLENCEELLKTKQETLKNTKQNLLKKLKEQKAKFSDDVQSSLKEIEVLSEIIEEYQGKLNEQERIASVQIQELSSDNAALNGELTEVKDLLKVANMQNGCLQSDSHKLQDDIASLTSKAAQMDDEAVRLHLQLQHVINENDDLKKWQVKMQEDSLTEAGREKAEKEELQTELAALCNVKEDFVRVHEEKEQVLIDVEKLRVQVRELTSKNSLLNDGIVETEKQRESYAEAQTRSEKLEARLLKEIEETKEENSRVFSDYKQVSTENESLLRDLAELKLKYETLLSEKNNLAQAEAEKTGILYDLESCKAKIEKYEAATSPNKLETDNKALTVRLNELTVECRGLERATKTLESQLSELENQYTEILHEKQLLQDEIQELKASPINLNHVNSRTLDALDVMHYAVEAPHDVRHLKEELGQLNDKLVQYKSLDLTNRSSIQFYENELQKLKNKNEKLNRRLDETLVTLNHCTELSTSTESEYLRNVLYNYMLGKEGVVLARVIAAVCKFDERQTEAILQREQQKQTLLGQLGFM